LAGILRIVLPTVMFGGVPVRKKVNQPNPQLVPYRHSGKCIKNPSRLTL